MYVYVCVRACMCACVDLYRPNIELTFNPRRYLQAVIVLEEFCKEVAATLQAKLVNEDKRNAKV